MLNVLQKRRVEVLSEKLAKAQVLAKDFVESEHPRAKDGEFTSGGSGDSGSTSSGDSKSPAKDSKESGSKGDEKSGHGLFYKLMAGFIAVKGGSFMGASVGYALMTLGALNPVAAAATAAGVGLWVGGKLYNSLTKAESKKISFKSDADGEKFLKELPKHLSADQLTKLNAFLQSKSKEWGAKS